MDEKKQGQIDRHKSDFDVMEHVISGWYPLRTPAEPRGQADDRGRAKRSSGGQKTSHSKPKLRHK